MNCYYHRNTQAVMFCKSCGKPICNKCDKKFHSFCLECLIDKATAKISKSIGLFAISAGIAFVAYEVFTNITDKESSAYIWLFLDMIYQFADIIFEIAKITLNGLFNISISDNMTEKMYILSRVYMLSSIPWGYHVLNKIFRLSGGSIIVIIIVVMLKYLISVFLGPIVMPIYIIVALISFIKNNAVLIHLFITKKGFERNDEANVESYTVSEFLDATNNSSNEITTDS